MDGTIPHSLPPEENDTHLWIPDPGSRDSPSEPTPSSSRAPQLLTERLFVGNLSPTVDEYALLQVFTKFGKIAKLDFLFHNSGINKGKPRGYAFVEYINEADAAKALQTANGKLFRGRKLVVTYAQQAPNYDSRSTSHGGRCKGVDAMPTALSLAKSSGIARPEAKTSSKIAMMEAKLRQMASTSSFAERPALPSKPVAPQTGVERSRSQSAYRGTRLISGKTMGLRNEGGWIGRGQSVASPPMDHAESIKIAPSCKQRSIPGVKFARGGPNRDSGRVQSLLESQTPSSHIG